MAQSDQVVQNATFPSVRADINDNLAALFSQSSGNSAPTVTVAYQPWVDTSSSPPVWKVRNGSNTAWISVGLLDPAGFNAGGITAIANGGTGATTAALALAALLPSQSGNAGKALVTSGSAASWGTVALGASYQVFGANGTYTPTTGKTTFLVVLTGGGGGGGVGGSGLGAGGGAAGTAIRLYNTTELGTTASVVIAGAGGAGGTGGTSTFTCTGTGGSMLAYGGAGGTDSTTTGIGGVGGATGGSVGFGLQGGQGGAAGYGSYNVGGASFWGGGYGRGGDSNNAGLNGICAIFEW